MTSLAVKTCTCCGVSYPATREFFGSTPSGSLRSQCRKCKRKVYSEWAKKNKRNVVKRAQKRQLLEGRKELENDYQFREKLFKDQQGCCAICGNPLDRSKIHDRTRVHIDHHNPLSKGGSIGVDNLGLAHSKCNQEKHCKTPAQYVAWRLKVGLPPVKCDLRGTV